LFFIPCPPWLVPYRNGNRSGVWTGRSESNPFTDRTRSGRNRLLSSIVGATGRAFLTELAPARAARSAERLLRTFRRDTWFTSRDVVVLTSRAALRAHDQSIPNPPAHLRRVDTAIVIAARSVRRCRRQLHNAQTHERERERVAERPQHSARGNLSHMPCLHIGHGVAIRSPARCRYRGRPRPVRSVHCRSRVARQRRGW
jgi:hypothetical protein